MHRYRPAIYIPIWLDRLVVAPLLLLRRIWYGYTFRRIPLVNSKKYAIVDPQDYYTLCQHTWWAHKKSGGRSAIRLEPEKGSAYPVHMHRQIMELQLNSKLKTQNLEFTNLPRNLVIDHINRNGLDNRRSNLRLATILQNNRNKRSRGGVSKYKGVVYRGHQKLWVARITVNGKRKYIKSCKSEIDAAKAYDAAAKKYYGRFGYLNFPPPQKPKGLKDIIKAIMNSKFSIFSGKRSRKLTIAKSS